MHLCRICGQPGHLTYLGHPPLQHYTYLCNKHREAWDSYNNLTERYAEMNETITRYHIAIYKGKKRTAMAMQQTLLVLAKEGRATARGWVIDQRNKYLAAHGVSLND